MRHAQTEYNKKGIIQGSEVDSDINDFGENQSSLFYNFYKSIPFDMVYVSALKRTYQTVRRFAEAGIPCKKLKEFNEISWGINQGKSDDLKEYEQLINSWVSGNLDEKFENGESPNEMSERLVKGFDKVIKENHENVLLCIHGRALRILLSKIIDKDLTKMDKYTHSNTGVYIIDYKDDEYDVVGENLRNHIS
jgi:probable phosphoglycerate mutase